MSDLLREVAGLTEQNTQEITYYGEVTHWGPEGASGYAGCSGRGGSSQEVHPMTIPEEPIPEFDWVYDVEFDTWEITEDDFADADELDAYIGELPSMNPVSRFLDLMFKMIRYPNPEDFNEYQAYEFLEWGRNDKGNIEISVDVDNLIYILSIT